MGTHFLKELLFPNIKGTFLRFPFPVLFIVAVTFLCIAKTNNIDIGFWPEPWFYLFMFVGFFTFTALRLFAEGHGIRTKTYLLLTFAIGAFLIYFCVTPNITAVSLLFSGVFFLLLVAPFIWNDRGESACCHYNTRMASSIFFSALATLVLCIGLSIVLGSITYLFDIAISKKLYANIWLTGSLLFAPFYALSGVPKDFEPEEKQYPKGIAFIFNYTLAPLIIIYFGILYTYIIKIALEWNLPKGNVAYMVLSFGIIGIFTHIFSYPLKETGGLLLKFVCRYFYYALLAPIALLFIGIGVRIHQYGVTEERYTVVLLAVWFLLSALYAIFSKSPKFKAIILTVSCLLIASSFGPWGAESVSVISQAGRLQRLLEENHLWANGKVKKSTAEPSKKVQKEISGGVTYMVQRHPDVIKKWFGPESYINTTNRTGINITKVMEDIGVPYWNSYQIKQDSLGLDAKSPQRFSYDVPKAGGGVEDALNVQGMDYFADIGYVGFYSVKTPDDWQKTLRNPLTQVRVVALHFNGKVLEATHLPTKDSVKFDFTDAATTLMHAATASGKIPAAGQKLFTFKKEGKEFEVRIYVKNISGTFEKGAPVVSHATFAVAVNVFKY